MSGSERPNRMAQLRRQVVRDFMAALETGNYDNWVRSTEELRAYLRAQGIASRQGYRDRAATATEQVRAAGKRKPA